MEISVANDKHFTRIRGDKTYELSNHLGNVLATVTDRKLGVSFTNSNTFAQYYQAEVSSATDYYPFGSPMPGRNMSSDKARYGFNGQEKESQWSEGNYDLGARFYNSKLGRMFSPDPRESEYPWQSTYAYFSNSPICQVDINCEGGEGNKETGEIKATVYFRFDSDIALTPNEQQQYIDNFKANVQSVWNNNVLDNCKQICVDDVQFLLAPNGISPSNLSENENLITVGNGRNANANAEQGVSYIDNNRRRNTGYMYYRNQGNEAAHEFGHMLGLSDRYFNGVRGDVSSFSRNSTTLISRYTIPMVGIDDLGYNYKANLMAGQNGRQSLTVGQLNIAFDSNQNEKVYSNSALYHNNTSLRNVDGIHLYNLIYYNNHNSINRGGALKYSRNNFVELDAINPPFLQNEIKRYILNNRTW